MYHNDCIHWMPESHRSWNSCYCLSGKRHWITGIRDFCYQKCLSERRTWKFNRTHWLLYDVITHHSSLVKPLLTLEIYLSYFIDRRTALLIPEYTWTTSCAHKWGQYTPALITTHLIQKYPIKISILQSCATQVGILQENFVPEEFSHHFAH